MLSLEEIMAFQLSNFAHVEETMTESNNLSQVVTSCQLHGKLVLVNLLLAHADTHTDQDTEAERQSEELHGGVVTVCVGNMMEQLMTVAADRTEPVHLPDNTDSSHCWLLYNVRHHSWWLGCSLPSGLPSTANSQPWSLSLLSSLRRMF